MKKLEFVGFNPTTCFIGLLLVTSWASAGDPAELEKLDREWGGTTDTARIDALVNDNIIALSSSGVGDKAQLLADNQPSPDAAPYTADGYKTEFLSDDIAVMVHHADGPEPHYSMHVWQRVDGNWQVVATATVPPAAMTETSEE